MKLGVKGRYSDLHIAAGILAFLKREQPQVTVKVVDTLVAETIEGMQVNDFG